MLSGRRGPGGTEKRGTKVSLDKLHICTPHIGPDNGQTLRVDRDLVVKVETAAYVLAVARGEVPGCLTYNCC